MLLVTPEAQTIVQEMYIPRQTRYASHARYLTIFMLNRLAVTQDDDTSQRQWWSDTF